KKQSSNESCLTAKIKLFYWIFSSPTPVDKEPKYFILLHSMYHIL
ncbi:hypothetical protein M2139_002831, partial [Enterococcus sp. PF1-24]|nr:hypothetical protein [Enterococcus sp. PFB1-1]MDH6402901.1 hypothetical protein [Enterococcus sp. PF1-24]